MTIKDSTRAASATEHRDRVKGQRVTASRTRSTATWVGLAGTPMADPDPAPAWRRVAATGLGYAMVAPWLAILGAVGFGLRRAGALNTEVPHTWSGRLAALGQRCQDGY